MAVITLVTGNPNKLRELSMLAPQSLEIVSKALDLPEIQSLDVQTVVEDKVRRAFEIVHAPVIVEDVSTGLDGLNGLPGPFFKFFESTLGKRALLRISDQPDPKVTIMCVAAYFDGKRMLFGRGVLHGSVVEPRGQNGFGFDFSVVPDGETRTISEMTLEEKNAISHRGQAYRELIAQLVGQSTG